MGSGDGDDETVMSPAESLAVIERQKAETSKRLGGDPLPFFLAWGLAWLVGFGAFFLRLGLDGRAYVNISRGACLVTLFVSLALAMAFTALLAWRQGSQVRGASQERGTMYGLSWSVGFVTMTGIAVRAGKDLPEAESYLLWASLSMLVVCLLFMAGGAVFGTRPMFAVGVALAAVNLLGVVLGPGWHALLASVVVGGGFIVIGGVLRLRGVTL
ncbi:hypothetical protein [Sphaerisporangium aureirubrum]|uniref:Transporter n=1 Tax=Sphaerisporangium aureirubrum TaxID=1544736 RepID=A0ABW1NB40_9ACTN